MSAPVRVIGAGVVGLTCALVLARRGVAVELVDRASGWGQAACSWLAGGMLAPWCERESAEPLVEHWGAQALNLWQEFGVPVERRGTLVVALGRDAPELRQFARRTRQFRWVGADEIAHLEPNLAGRFQNGLFFEAEGHLDPRATLPMLERQLAQLGVPVRWGVDAATLPPATHILDCRGLAARDSLPGLGGVAGLRGVKGEMLLLHAPDVSLSRPVRLLHPRVPLYVVPRGEGVFMVGATMIEADASRHVSARSLLEMLSSAYALVPGFGEAAVLEIGVNTRPAFTDNLPRLVWAEQGPSHWRLCVNGLYRHGFLLSPALAMRAARVLLDGATIAEVMDDADTRQWRGV